MIAVLDVGKTIAKLTLWTAQGVLVDRHVRRNVRCHDDGYLVLDVAGIEHWLTETLAGLPEKDRITTIIPVAHGAGAAMIRGGQLATLPVDYETPVPTSLRQSYDRQRDGFAETGSPCLPDGLNLGMQLHLLEQRCPALFDDATTIVPWAQYWSWRLSGVAASEVTSLGCHTDLWDPVRNAPSKMAQRRGWAAMLAPVRRADEVLGTITPEWVARTGLRADVEILCGLHDSNAALLAARGFREVADTDATVLSTGTWFIAMRLLGSDSAFALDRMPHARDCLVNVDIAGRMVPSARFMGGREIEHLTGLDTRQIDIRPDQARLVAAMPAVLARGARVLPTMTPGFGPYPKGTGRWVADPADPFERRAAVSLYAALVTDVSLDLIDARSTLLIEGRFAEAEVFVRAIASLRPGMRIYRSNAHNDVSYGAIRLVNPALPPPAALERVAPLDVDLEGYRTLWRDEAASAELPRKPEGAA